jgi:8-oxo-dGTP pyrophosphatase MutT (NUDIX family)
VSTAPETPGSSADAAEPGDETLTAESVIRVAAALIVDDGGRLLLVRKAGTSVFMQPGGKYEPGETGAQTLARELHEELGLIIAPDALEPLGTFLAPAANEAGMLVEAEVFRVTVLEPADAAAISAGAEIAELQWVHPDQFADIAIAPLVTERMMPLLD